MTVVLVVCATALMPSALCAQGYSGSRGWFERTLGLNRWKDQADAVVRSATMDSLVVALTGHPQERGRRRERYIEAGVEFVCEVKHYDLGNNHTRIVVGSPQLAALYPGALVRGRSLHTGLPVVVNLPRRPTRVSMWPHPGLSGRVVNDPTGDNVRDAISMLVSSSGNTRQAMLDYRRFAAHSTEQLAIESGMSIGWMGASAGSQMKGKESLELNTVVAMLDQVYYTASVDVPRHPNEAFRRVSAGELRNIVKADDPLGIVTEMAFGRRAVVRMTSRHAHDKMMQAAQFAYEQAVAPLGAPASGVDTPPTEGPQVADPRAPRVSMEQRQEMERVLAEATITVTVLGGPDWSAPTLVEQGVTGFAQFVKEGASFSRENPGYPLAYTVKNLGDGEVMRFGYTTTFDAFQCAPYEAELRVTLSALHGAVDPGDGGHGEVFGDLYFDGGSFWSAARSAAISIRQGATHAPSGGMASRIVRKPARAGSASEFKLRAVMSERDGGPFDPDDPLGNTERTFTFSDRRWNVSRTTTLATRANGAGIDLRVRVEELDPPPIARPAARRDPGGPNAARVAIDSATVNRARAVMAAIAGDVAAADAPLPDPAPELPPEVPFTELRRGAPDFASRTAGSSKPLDSSIPLDPANGGRSIVEGALQPGDVIFSTTMSPTSWFVRRFTGGGEASHIRLYAGNGTVIEAVPGSGVTLRTLQEVLAEDQYAVAFRLPTLTTGQARLAIDFGMGQLGKHYDYFGAGSDGRFRFAGRPVSINLGAATGRRFYCSTLVIEAFRVAGAAFGELVGRPRSPNDLVSLTLTSQLDYVGHLKFVP